MPKNTLTLELDRDLDLEADGADALSNKTGFLVLSFEYLILSKTKQTKTVKFYNISWDLN